MSTTVGIVQQTLMTSKTSTVFPVHAMKVLHSFLNSATDGGEWLRSGHFNPGIELQYPLKRWVGGPQSWSGRFGGQKNLFPLYGFRTVQPVVKGTIMTSHNVKEQCIGSSSKYGLRMIKLH